MSLTNRPNDSRIAPATPTTVADSRVVVIGTYVWSWIADATQNVGEVMTCLWHWWLAYSKLRWPYTSATLLRMRYD